MYAQTGSAHAGRPGTPAALRGSDPAGLPVPGAAREAAIPAAYLRPECVRMALFPERIRRAGPRRFSDVAGVILAGGESRRMGKNKALLEVNGEAMVERAFRRMSELFDEVLLVTNTPENYEFIPCRKIADIYAGCGPLGGIHAALSACVTARVFVVACDMPALNRELIRELCTIDRNGDVVIPETPGGLEPLHAVYARSCLPKMETMLQAGERRIRSFFDLAQVRQVPRDRVALLDPEFTSFHNINTPEDYRRLVHIT